EPDLSDQQQPGFGPVPCNVVHGVRWNAALAYLLPASDRPGLILRGHSEVTRILIQGKRATGVEYLHHGERRAASADEIVLAAGALSSPALLMRSGIGPREELERHGIPVVCDLPAVGAAVSDHPQVLVSWS